MNSRPTRLWERWNWQRRSLFISCVFPFIVGKPLQPSFSSAVPWFLKTQMVQRAFVSRGSENIHLDSANTQSSNTILLDISLRKKPEKCISAIPWPVTSHLLRLCVCVVGVIFQCVCVVCVCVLATLLQCLAQGQRRAGPHSNWTTDPTRLLVTYLALSRTFIVVESTQSVPMKTGQ